MVRLTRREKKMSNYSDPSFPPPPPPPSEAGNKKLAAGLCAILLGTLGIHKFILGYTTAGLIMLLCTLVTCGLAGLVLHVIGIIEGIIYLTKSDGQFYEMYMVNRREWF
jgi:TM2 domain-containing membrane protein YozV